MPVGFDANHQMDYVIAIDNLVSSLLIANCVPFCNSMLFHQHSVTLQTLGNGCFKH